MDQEKNIGGFQKFLLDNGWKRYVINTEKKNGQLVTIKTESSSLHVSSYGPLHYEFTNETFPDIFLYWGLSEYPHGPYFHIPWRQVIVRDIKIYPEQKIHINAVHDIFRLLSFDEIYYVLTSNTVFVVEYAHIEKDPIITTINKIDEKTHYVLT